MAEAQAIMPATEHAWKLITDCKWKSGSSEKFIVLCLAAEIDRSGDFWIPASWVAHRAGCSQQNATTFLNRPRNDDKVISAEFKGQDGKIRTYYSLKGWLDIVQGDKSNG